MSRRQFLPQVRFKSDSKLIDNTVSSLHTHSISPSIPSSAVLVRILAAPMNPADINLIQGTYGTKPKFDTILGTAEPSSVPGNEACLEVVSVGSSVKGLQKGDWCIPARTGFGTWRTHALVENAEQALIKVDKTGLTPEQVATVSVNPCSAYRMLKDYVDLIGLSVKTFQKDSETKGGAWFIQNGANSGVGRAAIQLGKLWGLRSINVIRDRPETEQTEELKKELFELGATAIVTESEFETRKFRPQLEHLTRGGKDPLMLGLNCVGGKNANFMSKQLSEGGTLVTYGAMSREPVSLPTGLLIFKDIRYHGFWLSRWADANREGKEQTVNEILGLIRDGKFKDAPLQEVKWDWETEGDVLKAAVQGTLRGFKQGKGIFICGDT